MGNKIQKLVADSPLATRVKSGNPTNPAGGGAAKGGDAKCNTPSDDEPAEGPCNGGPGGQRGGDGDKRPARRGGVSAEVGYLFIIKAEQAILLSAVHRDNRIIKKKLVWG